VKRISRRVQDEVDRLVHELLVRERDQRALEERARAAELVAGRLRSALDERERDLERADERARAAWLSHHPYGRLDEPVFDGSASAVATGDEDRALVERIIGAYACSVGTNYYGAGSMWRDIHEHVADVHEALVQRDVATVTSMLREPTSNHLFEGFESVYRDSAMVASRQPGPYVDAIKDLLVRLAEALALVVLELPDGRFGETWGLNIDLPTSEVVEIIERHVGMIVAIDPVHRGLIGLDFGGRLITGRMVHAVYLAHRANQLVAGIDAPRLLEIGAGLGYAAYYAHCLGLRDYTIADLPMTNVAQAYFLGRALGTDAIVLEGETMDARDASTRIKIATPRALREPTAVFDVVLNVNSLTEVGPELAEEYAQLILAIAPTFLSINHEVNTFTVSGLFRESATIDRFPYWLTKGYAEELIRRRG